MWPPPLLRSRGLPLQILFAGLVPAAFGALCGVMLGRSALWFNVLMLVSGPGGVGAGFEHAGWRGGARRGALGGSLFATAILIAHTIHGVPMVAPLPLPVPLPAMCVVYATLGVPLGALGGWLRGRADAAAAPAAST